MISVEIFGSWRNLQFSVQVYEFSEKLKIVVDWKNCRHINLSVVTVCGDDDSTVFSIDNRANKSYGMFIVRGLNLQLYDTQISGCGNHIIVLTPKVGEWNFLCQEKNYG